MNAPRNFSGVERAAVLMMVVGDEEAAAILQKLDPEEVRQLGTAMMSVADVSEWEMAQVLDDFTGRAQERSAIQFDPRPKLESVVTKALGPERASTILSRILPPEPNESISALQWMDATEIAAMLEEEHPQIAAVLLAHLEPATAGQVLEMLPEAIQPQVLRRVARLGPVTAEALATLTALLERHSSQPRRVAGVQMGGTREAAKIMSSVRKVTEQKVMPKLAKLDRDVARAIEEAMFVFDNLLDLDDKNMGTLLRNIESDVLVRSLKGADEAARTRFLSCMSSRAADTIRDEMEARGPMKLAEVLEAQKVMIAIARQLVKDGTITMPGSGGDDDYV
ncbi:flagellar motor switch protein FliG [Sphingomonas koreensis]|jgi:flagellar motor switch protein FliG|uniref:Flagellar motor switch protein FliG n=1 Tax=Sphingomonas koreensis TaxID=93064 RepID=A0A1L6J6M1_9SPHN|nr:flagellar motor switch protein FliG [Sphingomonas koreensis]APR51559.1 flagellar motor switch protein FliG [Sphingomonas koreensis]MDC7812731.1 flagellar motor switch protein FliG [Sphingomonas koreensis]PJI88780.1 flagellar motor switch protein FliG [Sphingomonas koreensis]RSU19416.1 flagellar motor switch protein FliG [Sphingomonas koreensis]RSU22553.1 flagellar motor switch protein FliG [Sphingomonas koreensis]